MAMDVGTITADLSSDEPHVSRAAYAAACRAASVEFTEAGYWRWRQVCRRLTGDDAFEDQIRRASDAIAAFGEAAAQSLPAFQRMAAAFSSVMTVNEARGFLHLPPLEDE